MGKILWVGLGGALGAMLRFGMVELLNRIWITPFPWGILGVNLTGSLLIGCLAGAFESAPVSPALWLFATAGLLGGFTTFSAFSLENAGFLKSGQYGLLILNVTVSVVLGIVLTFAGYHFGKTLAGR